ncbi:MAG: GMC family oxidoreductase [Deltaproteobacteria bacterium]|nr:GMC family oxidoreductase [Deltaproteobacteria bacterium]
MSELTAFEARIARALAETAIPPGDAFTPDYDRLVGDVEAFLASAPLPVRAGFRSVLAAIELDGLRVSKRRRFSRLDAEGRARVLEAWSESPHFLKRTALKSVVLPMKVACFASEASHKFFGYPSANGHAKATVRHADHPNVLRAADVDDGEEIRCEVVVVGTGAGGAAIAKELAERGVAVVMLEEGGYFSRADFTRRAYDMSKQMYRNGGLTIAIGTPGIMIPLGRTVGGTTTINSGTCFRVPQHTLDVWHREHGLAEFTLDTLASYYDRVEKILGVEEAKWEVLGEVARLVRKGADALGYSHRPLLRNAPGCEGSGVCCFGCPSGAKRSADISYVPLALKAGARVYTGAKVEKVLVKGASATGVVVRAVGASKRFTVRAERVVVSAGSLLTPTLLRRSGLRAKAIGRNLSVHPATRIAARFPHEFKPWEGIPQGYCIDEFHEDGILYEGAAVPPDFAGLAFPFYGARFTEAMENYRRTAIFGFLVEETSRGRVVPSRAPLPLVLYNINRADTAKIQRGLVILAKVFFAAGAERLVVPVHGHDEMTSPADIEKFARADIHPSDLELGAFHPLGTARMGHDPKTSVVNTHLESHEVRRLYVVDGSVFPSPLGVNPQVTIMALATRAAETIAAGLGRR